MPIVDAHVHIYPDKIAERAVESVGEFYTLEMKGGHGTVAGYQARMQSAGITHAIVHSVAVKAKTVESINNFIIASCQAQPNFIGFMAMHPDYENPAAEIDRCLAAGLKGMKIHPDTQGVNADDPRMMEIYAMLEGRAALILHAGDFRYDYSHPRRIKNICKAFPRLQINAAHFGGWSVFDLATEYLEDERCFMDCSSSFWMIGTRRAKELIRHYGAQRILFGSDSPMWEPAEELKVLMSLGLRDDELEQILWHNAERFANVTIA